MNILDIIGAPEEELEEQPFSKLFWIQAFPLQKGQHMLVEWWKERNHLEQVDPREPLGTTLLEATRKAKVLLGAEKVIVSQRYLPID